jgi:hypothetical protein
MAAEPERAEVEGGNVPLLAAALAVLGIDYTLEDVFALAKTSPEEAERKLAAYERAMAELRRELKDFHALVAFMEAALVRARAESTTGFEVAPKVAAEMGLRISGDPQRKLVVLSPAGRRGFVIKPLPTLGPRLAGDRAVPRARSPRRQRVRSSSSASRDGPDEPPLPEPEPGDAGLVVVPAKAAG